eukprot:scaffold255733_cov32-Tisochrysis_lutea.AAC.2
MDGGGCMRRNHWWRALVRRRHNRCQTSHTHEVSTSGPNCRCRLKLAGYPDKTGRPPATQGTSLRRCVRRRCGVLHWEGAANGSRRGGY